jgi:glycosyltransferase involved in cell wall biosynthesis
MLEPWAWRHKWWKKWPYFHLVEKRYLAGARALLATAEPEAKRLAHFLPQQHIAALPLGLTSHTRPDYQAAREHLGWKPQDRVLLYLSRIHVKKGLDLLLRALSTISSFPKDTRLVVVGDGDPDYLRALQSFANAHASQLPPIEWIGAVWGDARWPYFQGADLFCLPTHSENFGLAVLEACQVGTPALTTTETPWADQLTADRGYIARPTVESLRERLTAYFTAPTWLLEKRQALSEWAHHTYDWPNLAPQYLAFYQSAFSTIRTSF